MFEVTLVFDEENEKIKDGLSALILKFQHGQRV